MEGPTERESNILSSTVASSVNGMNTVLPDRCWMYPKMPWASSCPTLKQPFCLCCAHFKRPKEQTMKRRRVWRNVCMDSRVDKCKRVGTLGLFANMTYFLFERKPDRCVDLKQFKQYVLMIAVSRLIRDEYCSPHCHREFSNSQR